MPRALWWSQGGAAISHERGTPVPPHGPRSNSRCRVNSAHVRQSRPDYGLRVQVNCLSWEAPGPAPLGPCSRTMLRALWWSWGGGRFLPPRPLLGSALPAFLKVMSLIAVMFNIQLTFAGSRLVYRGTSLSRNSPPIEPYSRTVPRALWWSYGGGGFL